MSLTLTSFALNNTDENISTLEDFGTCVYSLTTYWSDGTTTTRTYITNATSQRDCELTAQVHALREISK